MNQHIKINKKEVNWKQWSEKGIKIIHNIVDDSGSFKTLTTLEEEYNIRCDFLKYNALKDAIPKTWREK
jgi:hypothetical protein